MEYLFYFLVVLVTFWLMEGAAWSTHKYIMHGFLWNLHRDHHQREEGFFEKNDWFSVFFAIPCIILFYVGTRISNPWIISVAIGIFLYGIAYFFVHDVIIHQRFKWFTHSRNTYIKAMRWAHKMHHKHLGPENGESFGFLLVEKKYREKIKRDQEYKHAPQV